MTSPEATSSPKVDIQQSLECEGASVEDINAPGGGEACQAAVCESPNAPQVKRGAKRTVQKSSPRPRKKAVAVADDAAASLASLLRCPVGVEPPWTALSNFVSQTGTAACPPPPILFPSLTDLSSGLIPSFQAGAFGLALPQGLPMLPPPSLDPTALFPASVLDPKVFPPFPPFLPAPMPLSAPDAVPVVPSQPCEPPSEAEAATRPSDAADVPHLDTDGPQAPASDPPPSAAALLCPGPTALPSIPLAGLPAIDPTLFGFSSSIPSLSTDTPCPDLLPPPALLAELPSASLSPTAPLDPVLSPATIQQLNAVQQKMVSQLKSLEDQLHAEGITLDEQAMVQQQVLTTRRQLHLNHMVLAQASQLCGIPDDPLRLRARPRTLELGDHVIRSSEWIGGKPTGIIQRKHSGWLVLFRSHSQRLRPDCPSKTFLDRDIPGATLQEVQLESYQRAFAWRNAISSEKGMTKNEYCIIDHPDSTKACRFLVVKATTKASGAPRVVKFVTDYKYRALVDRSVWTPKFNRGKVYITSRERTAEVPNGKITHFAKALMLEEGIPVDDFEQKFVNGEPRDLRFQNLCLAGRPPLCHCWDPLHTRYTKSLPFAPQPCMMEQGDACIHQTLSEFQWILDKSDTIV
eukprot:GGOE01017775.1.p1 GENE.GGOE01017775.1~~GGOE01017775.1.p1  ORF type:complete len:633 (+),score=102.86 GGOE01017775.1:36-1934(+)